MGKFSGGHFRFTIKLTYIIESKSSDFLVLKEKNDADLHKRSYYNKTTMTKKTSRMDLMGNININAVFVERLI